MSVYFTAKTTRAEYERMRKLARFWSVYRPRSGVDYYPPNFVFDYWNLFGCAVSPDPLSVRLNDYQNAKEIPY